MEMVKTFKALMDGVDVVRKREALIIPKKEFISDLFLKVHPVHIFLVNDDEAKEIHPNAIGMYLSSLFIEELSEYPTVLIVYAEGFNTETLSTELGAALIFDDEFIDFKVKDCFELTALFQLIKNRCEGAEV